MKFFVAFVALIAVSAAASFHKPTSNFEEELQAIMNAIHSPSTDPATAILLQQQLDAILGINPEPINVDPVIVDPVIVDEAPQEVPVAAESSPLVEIIINVNSGSAAAPSPVIVPPRPEPITLSSYERLLELKNCLSNINFDILGISEVRRLGCEMEEYETFILCYKGQTAGYHGVGFIINKSMKNNIETLSGISERVAILNLDIECHKTSIIQVYFPTSDAKEVEIDELYETIEKTIKTAHKQPEGDSYANV
ncbi:unnamed protein product [Euphydryas editha]|uniref:Uncharacterized protein n=1 Tax=Euphydryas editha TaxID=104508 RepID=A0AAU9TW73_EUPED|nr:unnamed protein product [Euphydryas editha]